VHVEGRLALRPTWNGSVVAPRASCDPVYVLLPPVVAQVGHATVVPSNTTGAVAAETPLPKLDHEDPFHCLSLLPSAESQAISPAAATVGRVEQTICAPAVVADACRICFAPAVKVFYCVARIPAGVEHATDESPLIEFTKSPAEQVRACTLPPAFRDGSGRSEAAIAEPGR